MTIGEHENWTQNDNHIGTEKPRRRVGKDRQRNRVCGESTGHSMHLKEKFAKMYLKLTRSQVMCKQNN